MFGVVDGRVEIEHEFRHDPELLPDLAAEFSAQGLVLILEREHHFRLFFGGEDAHVRSP